MQSQKRAEDDAYCSVHLLARGLIGYNSSEYYLQCMMCQPRLSTCLGSNKYNSKDDIGKKMIETPYKIHPAVLFKLPFIARRMSADVPTREGYWEKNKIFSRNSIDVIAKWLAS